MLPALNMHRLGIPINHDIYQLHIAIFSICIAIALGVFSVLIYTLIVHRKSQDTKAVKFHKHTWVEVVWAIIPVLIAVTMVLPAALALMDMGKSAPTEENIASVDSVVSGGGV